jgi:hypothetical protein
MLRPGTLGCVLACVFTSTLTPAVLAQERGFLAHRLHFLAPESEKTEDGGDDERREGLRDERPLFDPTIHGAGVLATPIEDAASDGTHRTPAELFQRGQWSVQYLSGYLFSPMPVDYPKHREINFIAENIRISRVLFGTNPDRFLLKGSLETVGELNVFPITAGPGSIILGSSLFLRYNLSNRSGRFVPYAEAGLGISYLDIYRAPNPPLSLAFAFIIHGGIGTHVFLSRRWSLDAEMSYYHLSNNGWGYRNRSVNGFGALLGFTYYLDRRKADCNPP